MEPPGVQHRMQRFGLPHGGNPQEAGFSRPVIVIWLVVIGMLLLLFTGQMVRSLESIHNGCGIVLYKAAGKTPNAPPRSLPVVFVAAEDFIKGLRDAGLAEYVRKLRNTAFHGC